MKKENRRSQGVAVCSIVAFVLWTLLVCFADVQPIGPEGSSVGLASVNEAVHQLTGVNMLLYTITDWLGLVSVGVAVGFGLLGLTQWIRRKSLRYVESSILILGGFYIAVIAVFVFFEIFVVNYRPVLIDGKLEASYPSSHTMLALCVMITAKMQFASRMRNKKSRQILSAAAMGYAVFMVAARFLSGVHWFTDIIGGILLSTGLILIYKSVCNEVSLG